MDLGLKDKVALVTGAGQGMGRGIALALAAEGCNIIVNDLNAEAATKVTTEVAAMGRHSLAIKSDVSNWTDVQHMFANLSKHYEALDILINCAGIGDSSSFEESTREDWDKVLGVCLYGTLHCTREAIPGMIKRKRGKIVSIVSDAGRVGEPGLVVYSAAKAGIIAFSKALAKELGPHNINVNCVSPGATMTDHIREMHAKMKAEMGEKAFADRQRKVLKKYPLGRLGEVTDVASTVVYLVSDRAAWITGQTLSVSGGYSMA